MVAGNKVIDQEIVTPNLPDGMGRVEVIAIYDVERGKIANAWFIFGPSTRDDKAGNGFICRTFFRAHRVRN
jgi:hypothetical protein